MTDNSTPETRLSDADAGTIARACLAYGVFGIASATPLLAFSLWAVVAPSFEFADKLPPLLPMVLITAFYAFAVWTFSLPLMAGIRLVSVSRSIRTDPDIARTRFLQAYRVAKIGCVFSFIPFLAILGSWGIVFLGMGFIVNDFGLDSGTPIYWGTFALSILAVVYYVVFFRLRKMRDRWFSGVPAGD